MLSSLPARRPRERAKRRTRRWKDPPRRVRISPETHVCRRDARIGSWPLSSYEIGARHEAEHFMPGSFRYPARNKYISGNPVTGKKHTSRRPSRQRNSGILPVSGRQRRTTYSAPTAAAESAHQSSTRLYRIGFRALGWLQGGEVGRPHRGFRPSRGCGRERRLAPIIHASWKKKMIPTRL